MSVWAVVLAGGVGSRFWPWSTAGRPKQLLPLVSDKPLLADTLARLRVVAPPERTLLLTSSALAPAVAATATEVPRDNVVAEPRAAGTAGALAWAAMEIRRRDGEDAVMICVHADWAIGDASGFARALESAARVAEDAGALVTVGIVPTRDESGFGYVIAGEEQVNGARRVSRFVEKPTRERAAALRSSGALWNSGIFAWKVGVFLGELRSHTPEVARALDAVTSEDFFRRVEPVTVDVGLLERSSNVLVIPGDFGWDDVGTWAALLRARATDDTGNVTHGPVQARDSRGNVAYSAGPALVLYGVSDLIVVSTGRTVLVTTAERAADLKQLVDSLPTDVRDDP
jgi:mannose-1-phosphate guanylyltransferase